MGHPALRPNSLARLHQPAACGHRTTDTTESTDGTESVPSSPSVFQWCQGARRAFSGGDGKRSLLRYAFATASIHGIAATGHPVLRLNSLARIFKPLCEISPKGDEKNGKD